MVISSGRAPGIFVMRGQGRCSKSLGKARMSETNRGRGKEAPGPPLSLLGAWLRAAMCVPMPFSPLSLLFSDPETPA